MGVDANTTHPLGKKCYNNVMWAKDTGIYTQPKMYENYTTLTNTSSFADFQCALYGMVGGDEAGTGHGCPMPCGSTLPDCYQAPPEDKGLPDSTTTTEPSGSGSSGLPWWAWLLIALALAACIGGLAYYFMFMNKPEAPKKKKRATKPTPAPEPTVSTAVPVATAPPVYVAPPVYTQAAPVAYATPVAPVTYAAPAMATPVVLPASYSTAVPVSSAAPVAMATPVSQSFVAMPVGTY